MFRLFEEQEYKNSSDTNHRKLASDTESSAPPIPILTTSTPINAEDWHNITGSVDPAAMSCNQNRLFSSANNVPTSTNKPNGLSKSAGDLPTRIVGFVVPDNKRHINQEQAAQNYNVNKVPEDLSTDMTQQSPLVAKFPPRGEEKSSSSSYENENESYFLRVTRQNAKIPTFSDYASEKLQDNGTESQDDISPFFPDPDPIDPQDSVSTSSWWVYSDDRLWDEF